MWTYRGVPEVYTFWAVDENANSLGPFSLYIGTDGTFNMYKMIRAD